MVTATAKRMPALFVSHGGGPTLFMPATPGSRFARMSAGSHAASWFAQLATQIGTVDGGKYGKPKAIVIVSAHWEAQQPGEVRITKQATHPKLHYDYSGFPAYTYAPHLVYPAPGQPELADHILDLINNYTQQHPNQPPIHPTLDTKYNFDHGVFIPLKMMYPDADIPVVEVSINDNWDVDWHIRLGEALAPLRDEQVLLIGSGFIVHNMRDFTNKEQTAFVAAVQDVVEDSAVKYEQRVQQMKQWTKLPAARIAHPEEDHLVPLFVVVGAAGESVGMGLNSEWKEDLCLQSFAFD